MEFCDTESQDPTKASATRLLEVQLGSRSQKPRPASLQQICGEKMTPRNVDESKITHARERDGKVKKQEITK